jgi:hypothetical protein
MQPEGDQAGNHHRDVRHDDKVVIEDDFADSHGNVASRLLMIGVVVCIESTADKLSGRQGYPQAIFPAAP